MQGNGKGKPTPHQFLREIGLQKRPELERGSKNWLDAVRRAGVDPTVLESNGTFSPAAGDVFFADDRVGRSTLSGDFARYLDHLKAFDEFWKFPESPKQIVELAGGAGVVSLYLARRYPAARVTVYDWAERPLAMGRRLAGALAINNIDFQSATFVDLADGKVAAQRHGDITLLYYGLPLDAEYPANAKPFLDREVVVDKGIAPDPQMTAGVGALARLLADDGIGIVCGNWTTWGATTFFEAVRRENLGIDWTRSFLYGDVRDDCFHPSGGYAFVGRGRPSLTLDSWEDAQAFFAGGELKDSKSAFSVGATEAISGLFSGGRELLVAKVSFQTGGEERVRLVYRSALVFLEHTSTLGFRRACFNSLNRIRLLGERVESLIANWKRNPAAQIHPVQIDPEFKPIADALNIGRMT